MVVLLFRPIQADFAVAADSAALGPFDLGFVDPEAAASGPLDLFADFVTAVGPDPACLACLFLDPVRMIAIAAGLAGPFDPDSVDSDSAAGPGFAVDSAFVPVAADPCSAVEAFAAAVVFYVPDLSFQTCFFVFAGILNCISHRDLSG